jgi:hypothetical protein
MSDIESKKLAKRVERDHAKALRSVKLGERLVQRTVGLIKSNAPETRLISPRLYLGRVDRESTGLALNAALKQQGINAKAEIAGVWDGGTSDGATLNYLRLQEVDGKPAIDPERIDRYSNALLPGTVLQLTSIPAEQPHQLSK